MVLAHCGLEGETNEKIVLAAVRQDGALGRASTSLIADMEVVLAVVRQD